MATYKIPSRSSFISLDSSASKDGARYPYNTPGSAPVRGFDVLVEEAMAFWHMPGLAVSVVDGKRIFSRGYGVAHLSTEAPHENCIEEVTPSTLFNIASMSKSFTAAAMALLVEEKGLEDVEWRTPVSKLVDDFVFETNIATQSISVEDILSHRSGLPGHEETLRGINHDTPDTPASVIRNMRNLRLSRPVRTEWQYSNLLYTCAAEMVAVLAGCPFESVLQSRFWTPLRMQRTFLGLDKIPVSERAHFSQGHVWIDKESKHKASRQTPEPESIGASSIISNVEDVARWLSAFVHRTAPLLDSSYSELSRPRMLISESNIPYLSPCFAGLGWEIQYYRGHALLSHDGRWAGCMSTMLYMPSKEYGFVMMGNCETAGPVQEVGWHLIDSMLGVPMEQRFDWRTHMVEQRTRFFKVASKEDLFPELQGGIESSANLDVADLVGSYWNEGYHDLDLRAGPGEGDWLEVDWTTRAYPRRIVVREHAYDNLYVAHVIDQDTESVTAIRCGFEVDERGTCHRVGFQFYGEAGDMVWFDRVGGETV